MTGEAGTPLERLSKHSDSGGRDNCIVLSVPRSYTIVVIVFNDDEIVYNRSDQVIDSMGHQGGRKQGISMW